MFRIIRPNTVYADLHGEPCVINRATATEVYYRRRGRNCIASMDRFNQDFELLTREEAEIIKRDIEQAEHIAKLRAQRAVAV
ncbi:DUF4222 domain-containing protein [Buttiauxella sp. BIGb0471]|uniref:DUF4222 domain-containing protein n=1 Tax=Buttiauxella sp. BIGb0471 TaxID=2940597 RepID=UPI002166E7D1|nr:DUF4222 domain-containing protein [Buttiauxella sp. BIGb0471]